MPKPIEFIRMVQRGDARPLPWPSSSLHPHRRRARSRRDRLRCGWPPRQSDGTLTAAFSANIADAAMGMAYAATPTPTRHSRTLELKIQLLKPVVEAGSWRPARRQRGGRTVGLVECDVLDDTGTAGRARVQYVHDAAGRARRWGVRCRRRSPPSSRARRRSHRATRVLLEGPWPRPCSPSRRPNVLVMVLQAMVSTWTPSSSGGSLGRARRRRARLPTRHADADDVGRRHGRGRRIRGRALRSAPAGVARTPTRWVVHAGRHRNSSWRMLHDGC